MQIADVQEIPQVSSDTLKLLELAIKKEHPDLIVFTGDQIYGLVPLYKIGATEKKVRNVIDKITLSAEKYNIPFAVTFGNHDRQCGMDNHKQAHIYGEKDHYIRGEFRNENDKGTYRIPLYNEKEDHIFDIFLFDSNGQAPTGEYMPVLPEQLDWYRDEREKAKENDVYIPSIVFQHIPVPEYYDVIRKVSRKTKGAVEAFRTHKNEWYVLPDEIKAAGGFMYESPAVPDKNSGEFDMLKEKGNVLALAAGHDHNNSFVAEKDGIKLIYTQCAGFNVYGPKLKRGVRMFELAENDLKTFNTYTLTYDELTRDKLKAPLKEFVLTHIPTSMEQVKRIALIGGTTGILCSATAYKILKSKYFSKNLK